MGHEYLQEITMKLAIVLAIGFAFASVRAVQAANPVVVVDTSMGEISIELFEDKSPITVKNFLDYVEAKHYDGLIFHRVIPGFMIQGGGMEPGMKERKTRDPIKNEASNGVSNERGTIAMARTNNPDSATGQFFININNNTNLNKNAASAGYCAFGRVIKGMEVVDKIKDVPTGNKGPHGDVPTTDVTIKSIRKSS